nr:MAG TPA_asm: hypothetical protein [Caudoviricetes sp.]
MLKYIDLKQIRDYVPQNRSFVPMLKYIDLKPQICTFL